MYLWDLICSQHKEMELSQALASDNKVPNYPQTADSFFRSCFSSRQDIPYHLKNTTLGSQQPTTGYYHLPDVLNHKLKTCSICPINKWSLPFKFAMNLLQTSGNSCSRSHFALLLLKLFQCVPIRNTMQLLQHTRPLIVQTSQPLVQPPTWMIPVSAYSTNYCPPHLETISCIYSLRTPHFNNTECNCSFTSHL